MRVLCPQVGMDRHLGGGRYDYEMLSALSRLGQELLLLLPQGQRGYCPIPKGCKIKWVSANWRWHPFLASAVFFLPMLRAARAFKPDLIRVHSPYCLGLASLAVGRLLDIPAVACFHHSFESFRGARWTERNLLPKFTHVITVSEFSKRQLVNLHEGLSVRSTVIYNGVSKQFRPNRGEMSSWKYEHSLPVESPLFVTVGTLIPRKNTLWLVKLMEAWAATGKPGVLVIVGEGPERECIQQKITKCRLRQRVFLWRAIDDETLVSLLQAADLFLLPSLMEGFGFAVAEALACGTPAIVSNRGALAEVVRHGRTGFVLPLDKCFTPWIQAMQTLVSDTAIRSAMAVAAEVDVRERFDWDRAGRAVVTVFERAAGIGCRSTGVR